MTVDGEGLMRDKGLLRGRFHVLRFGLLTGILISFLLAGCGVQGVGAGSEQIKEEAQAGEEARTGEEAQAGEEAQIGEEAQAEGHGQPGNGGQPGSSGQASEDNGQSGSLEQEEESVLRSVLISPEGDYIYEGVRYYPSREAFLAENGFTDAKPCYTYHREDGSLQMEFFQTEENASVCIRYLEEESAGIRMGDGLVMQGYVFQGSRETEWSFSPYSLRRRDGEDCPGPVTPECEYNEDGRLVHFHGEGPSDVVFSEDEKPGQIMPFLDISFSYREDGTLLKKEYWHNGLLFGTYGSSETSYFDESERLVYQSTYITHGTCESYYIYEDDDARIPSYRLYLDYDGSQNGSLESFFCPGIREKESYGEILDAYVMAFGNNWDFLDLDYLGISYIYQFMDNYGHAMERFGYALLDIDGDGIEELVIGAMEQEDDYERGLLYDLYTMRQGLPVKLAESGGRYSYHLCADNTIVHSGSDGAANNTYAQWRLAGEAGVQLLRAAIQSCDVWHYSDTFYAETMNGYVDGSLYWWSNRISEEEGSKLAKEIMDGGKERQAFTLTSFEDYLIYGLEDEP